MSVREATNVPNANLSNVGNSSSSQSTDSSDTTGSTESGSTNETAAPSSATSFYDQEANFQSKENNKRRAMDKTIGDNTIAAASPIDSDGGKEVQKAAGKAGMTVPSKQMLTKVQSAVKDNPQMKTLQSYVASGLSGQDPNFSSASGVAKAQSLAANVAQSSGLMSSGAAAAFGATQTSASGQTSSGQTAQATAGGAASTANSAATTLSSVAPQTQQLAVATAGATTTGQTTSATTGASGTAADATTDATDTATDTTGQTTTAATTDSAPSWLSGGNISAIVLLACSASMDEDNKIKAGRLNDMQKYNQISSLISDYISNTLQPAQAALDKKTATLKGDAVSQARVSVDTWANVDADNLFQDSSGNFGISKTVETERLGTSGLSAALSAAQGYAQTASNNSEQASNRFQATDNQTNQTFTMLTGFLKAINDSNSAIIRNYA